LLLLFADWFLLLGWFAGVDVVWWLPFSGFVLLPYAVWSAKFLEVGHEFLWFLCTISLVCCVQLRCWLLLLCALMQVRFSSWMISS
jgi:hypothetical protein